MKGFVKHLFVFSLALVLGCALALLHVAEAEEAYASVHGTTTPYTLVDTEGHAHHPGQSFVAIIPAERIAAVNQVRFPSSPVAERVGSHAAFSCVQHCCCQLMALREKSIRHDYEGYRAQLCSRGHYLYSLCKMLI
ncbi:MAG TPA: hypothetical protein H9834_07350 [Candidatus Barnesiella excrementavium]|nr:hypothetical protein [Candidatus Barnesiella excrementavium]